MKLSLLSTLASGVFACAVAIATGLSTHMALTQAEANIAEAKTVEVLQATATKIAEQKERTLVISATLIPTSEVEQMVNAGNPMIPLHEAPTAPVEALAPVTIYPTPIQPTSTTVPPGVATVTANIDTHYSTGTPVATDDPTSTPLALPLLTETPTPDEVLAVVVTLDMQPTATYAPTLTLTPEPPPTPAPTDAPKATVIPTPQPVTTSTVDVTPIPLPTETATQAPTVEPSATVTSGPLVSVLPTPEIVPSVTEEATAAP